MKNTYKATATDNRTDGIEIEFKGMSLMLAVAVAQELGTAFSHIDVISEDTGEVMYYRGASREVFTPTATRANAIASAINLQNMR